MRTVGEHGHTTLPLSAPLAMSRSVLQTGVLGLYKRYATIDDRGTENIGYNNGYPIHNITSTQYIEEEKKLKRKKGGKIKNVLQNKKNELAVSVAIIK